MQAVAALLEPIGEICANGNRKERQQLDYLEWGLEPKGRNNGHGKIKAQAANKPLHTRLKVK